MYIAICDDDQCYCEAIANSIERWHVKNADTVINISCYFSTEDLLERINSISNFDIIFLDIQVPGELSGLELAKHIRLTNEIVTIVFITNYSEYAFEGYKVNALRYIKKPVQDDKIFECLDIVNMQSRALPGDIVALQGYSQQCVFHYINIILLEATGHYLYVYENKNSEPVKIRANIKCILPTLPSNVFVQCHRCFIVNLMYVRRLTRTELRLSNNMTIPISAKYTDVTRTTFLKYYQGAML